MKAAGIALLVLSALMALGAVWFWALFGISENVGLAWYITTFVVGIGGAACLVGSS